MFVNVSNDKFCGKCSVWRHGLSVFLKVSCQKNVLKLWTWNMFVLEVWIVTFGGGLVESVCFGDESCQFANKCCNEGLKKRVAWGC